MLLNFFAVDQAVPSALNGLQIDRTMIGQICNIKPEVMWPQQGEQERKWFLWKFKRHRKINEKKIIKLH